MLAKFSRKPSYADASYCLWEAPLLADANEANFFVKGLSKILVLSYIVKESSLMNIRLRRFKLILASYFKS